LLQKAKQHLNTAKTAITAIAAKNTSALQKSALALLNKLKKLQCRYRFIGLKNKLKLAAHPLFAYYKFRLLPGSARPAAISARALLLVTLQKDTAKVNTYLRSADVKSLLPAKLKFLWGVKPMEKPKVFELYAIKLTGAENGPVLTGDVINDARNDVDQLKGQLRSYHVHELAGCAKMENRLLPKHHRCKKAIAIVLDDNVYSAPNVQNEISGGVSSISGGNFTLEDTKDLANVLKAGRLPAPARIIGEEVVGPSLGQQAISAGLLSCVLGLVVVSWYL
jgi:SecD/SecF fusion protein